MFDNLNTIKEIYARPGNHLVCLEGKKGTGKTTVLQEFVSNNDNVIQIESSADYTNYLYPMMNGLYQYSRIHKLEFKETVWHPDFTYEEGLLEQVLNICISSQSAILFFGFADYSKEFIKFIIRVISAVLRNGKNCSIFIEIDSDDSSLSSKVQSIYSFPQQEHIYFSEIESDELKSVFLSEHPNILIAERDLNYIVSSASKNPAIMNIIVNYLKSKNYITYLNGRYRCKPLQMGILSDILNEYFLSRFNRLDELMKATFLKSSMFGIEFYVSHLENSFEILSANEMLKQIEESSSLLIQKEIMPSMYSFSNNETLYFAKSIITEEQKTEWGNILYNYYRKLWEQMIGKNNRSPESFAVRTAYYAMVAHKYQEAESFYIAAIFFFMKKNNFQQVLLLLDEVNKLFIYREISPVIRMHLAEFRAICYENLGQYQTACQAYREVIRKFEGVQYFDVMNAQYHLAYCTYYTSQVDLSLQLAESLKNKLTPDLRKDSLYYRLVSLLATIYREKANPKYSEMFLIAIDECRERGFEYEYYVQLRKADLCYDVEFSIPMLKQAVTYFKDNHYRKEYGKAVHNLGTDFLYLGNAVDSQKNLIKSRKIFATYGSVDEVYAINCLGVWYAIIKNDYHQALQLFYKAENMPINDFKKMTIYANMAACYQKLHIYEKAEEYIHKCELLPARKNNKGVGFYQRTILLAWAFYYMEQKQYLSSLKMFRACWTTTLKNDQSYITAICSMDLCKILKVTPIKQEQKFSQISHSKLYEKYYENKSLFHTLRFIE